MSPFLKWPITALTLIGSIIGAALTLTTFFGMLTRGLSVRALPIFLIAGALYALGLAAGILFAQNDSRRGLIRIYYALQILWLSSPFVSFRFVSGAHFMPAIMGEKLTLSYGFGSVWHIASSGAGPWGLGINLVALTVFWLLRGSRKNGSRKKRTRKR
ncbi:hypothetical protein AXK12_00675 [Cephaloticoccus capnophilus]|uniref:Uncharacterized protein n=1 Tax=Cephaloticoccus capnophilus TaxID=1548208 RepID=A0A139SU19_9BACT|nr:hypothetical protein [Cephaloticoccus capnophilus]KXU38055.1 hypothetical protein AXK12_00675 [Cephaloticoccus capnophilus]